jgi:glycine cleavage system transcriptional repressor
MNKTVISVLGYDRPGIIAAVSRTLSDHRCNIEDVSQTILQSEFVGVFIASRPEDISQEALLAALKENLDSMGLSVFVKPMAGREEWVAPRSEPFIITTTGPDRIGLVAGITEIMALHRVNISNLKAVFRGSDDPMRNIMIYEVDIPLETDQNVFRSALCSRAQELGLEISFQHRDIFEALHRV